MKKTLIALFAVAGLAPAADFLSQWNFDSATKEGDTIAATYTENGSTLSLTSTASIENGVLAVSGQGTTIALGSSWSNVNQPITIAMEISSYGALSTDNHHVIWSSGNDTTSYIGPGFSMLSGTSGCWTANAQAKDKGYAYYENGADLTGTEKHTLVFTLSGFNGSETKSVGKMYLDGELMTTEASKIAYSKGLALTKINLGSFGSNSTYCGSEYELSRLAIYSGVLDESIITANTQVFKTPEPATATLSLLALAGLASRRRRH